MLEHAKATGKLKKPTRYIISCKNAKQKLFTTPQLRQFMEIGLVVSNITSVYQYRLGPALKDFFLKMIAKRRREHERFAMLEFASMFQCSSNKLLKNLPNSMHVVAILWELFSTKV